MKKGKLKYISEHKHWKIVDKKGHLHEPNLASTSLEIKLDGLYIHCFINYIAKGIRKKPGWYIEFWDTIFILDKSQTYLIKYKIY